jgi:hypothetical protein
MKSTTTQRSQRFSLAPGFSRVFVAFYREKPFQRFSCAMGKPLKRFVRPSFSDTRLKPGANEMSVVLLRFRAFASLRSN